jgi:serine/threonine protein kinase
MADESDEIDAVVFAAIELASPEVRAAFIRRQCGSDMELCRRVERLVAAYFRAGNFLDAPPPALARSDVWDTTETVGAQIGRYKLVEQIGEGGFGSVYLAEQTEPVRRRVALKIIKLGMDTRQVVARFEAERQALAMMDHPSIAKVFDAGATGTGRTYFVMEFVDGAPITEYCDAQRLAINDRLKLFEQVCQAVQHAHQKGIIHRDLKPTNVLVTTEQGRAVAKVIDFGVAKSLTGRLTEKTLFTEQQQLIGTPAYMSPEQADGSLDVDTRSDVYSLGVLLYELLTGVPPFDPQELRFKAFAEMQRIIREVDPLTPSAKLGEVSKGTGVSAFHAVTRDNLAKIAESRSVEPERLSASLRGELDWIVMRCLEKDRARRYPAAINLAEDVRRYLADLPVEARPPTVGYRLGKFARRNKFVLAATTLVALALLSAAVLSTWQAIRASRAEQQALANAHQADGISNFLVDAFGSLDPDRDGRKVTIVDILERTVDDLKGKFNDEPLVKAKLLHTLGRSYTSLGLPEQAAPLHEEALKLREAAFGQRHEDTLTTMASLALAYVGSGKKDEAVALGERHLKLRQEVNGPESLSTIRAMSRLGNIYRMCGRAKDAVPLATEVAQKTRERLGADDEETLRAMFEELSTIGQARWEGEKIAMPYWFEDIYKLAVPRLGKDHSFCLAIADNMGVSAMNNRYFDYAGEVLMDTLRRRLEELGPQHQNTRRSISLLAELSTKQADPRKAMKNVDYLLEVAPTDPKVIAARDQVKARLISETEMIDRYVKRIQRAQDRPYTDSPRKLVCRELAEMPDIFDLVAQKLPDETALWIGRGQDHILRDQLTEAEADYAKVIAQRPFQDEHYEYGCLLLLRGDDAAYQAYCERELPRDPQELKDGYVYYVATRLAEIGPANCVDAEELVKWAEIAVGNRQAWQLETLGLAYLRANRLDEAIKTFLETNPLSTWDSAVVRFGLAMAYHGRGDEDEAQKWLKLARTIVKATKPPRAGERTNLALPSTWLLIRCLSREADAMFGPSDGFSPSQTAPAKK